MSKNKPTRGGRAKKTTAVSLVRSSAAEYLTFVAASGNAETSVEMRYEDENVWLTQKMMAALYNVSVPAINQHLKRIFSDNELEEASVVKQCLIAAADGKCYQTKHYSLQAMSAYSPIPTGLHPSAQGCRVREATLGNMIHYFPQPQRGCIASRRADGFNPFRVVGLCGQFPRVARFSQPWADRRSPFGANSPGLEATA